MEEKTNVTEQEFQPTLPVRGATGEWEEAKHMPKISTHAPRAGSDLGLPLHQKYLQISTHAPRAGSDISLTTQLKSPKGFQPTLPVRGATGV